MTLWEIFRFEFGYQSRRASTWLYFLVLLALALVVSTEPSAEYAQMDGSFANGPFLIAVITLFGGTMGLLIVAAVAGDAAARDAQTRTDPLLYTTPVGKTAYVAGRYLAAFGLSAVLLSAVPIGQLLAASIARPDPDLIGPFRPAAYLGAYLFLLLPNVFVSTAIMFSVATLSRRAMMSYVAGVLLLGMCAVSSSVIARASGQWEVAKVLDPIAATVLDELSMVWTPAERSMRLIALQGAFLWNRVLWIGIALAALTFMYGRFQFAHDTAGAPRGLAVRVREGDTSFPDATVPAAPQILRSFGVPTYARQVCAIAWESFRAIATGWGGLVLVATAGFLAFSGLPIAHMGVPLVATTERIIAFLAAPLARLEEINLIVVPLLIVYCAGEVMWRERESRLAEIADAMPVPDWVLFLGKFAALALVLVALQTLMMGAGMLLQVRLGNDDLQIGLYARALFGLQLADFLLFALLALVIHALVNHKYVGHLVAALAYLFMVFAPALGLQHNLLIYGSDPGWTYSDMRGFDPFIAPWLWFKLYWTAWALVLAVTATLFLVRGRESHLGSRLALARRRSTRRAAGIATATLGLALTLGGFIFYNTNVLNAYASASESVARRAEYERRYGQFRDTPQPRITGVKLDVEIYPRRRAADVRGTFFLLNATAAAIDTIHLATKAAVNTSAVHFDRPVRDVISDDTLGHRVVALDTPLGAGESLRLDFEVHFKPRGFTNRGIDASVAANGTFIANEPWLPAIGYQPERELRSAVDRRAQGLAPRPEVATLDDETARNDAGRAARFMLEAVVGTDEGQVAIAPGRLRRTWTEHGRRYFDYATDAPIRNDYGFFSAAYAVRAARWNPSTSSSQAVSIEVFHHPNHAWNVDRMVRGVQASLDYYTKHFGPYPHGQIRLVETPGGSVLLHASPVNIFFEEAFSLLSPERDPRKIDLPFAVVAHEVAHQWWGNTLIPAEVEGAALLTESLAWYSALGVVEEALGREHLQRLLRMMREIYVTPQTRANAPLLRANDQFLAYRKGPFAMYALREYIGVDRVNEALRRLLDEHASGAPPLATSRDLYRELQSVTPDELRHLLVDLFETNTFWEVSAQEVTAKHTETGSWQVSLDVLARKVVVDSAGVETEVPMNDLVEVGVFATAKDGGLGEPLYLRMHRIRSGEQRITVTVPSQPARAGIDPRNLLIDVRSDDNLKEPTGRRKSRR